MRARLADAFDFAPCGPIEIKGVRRQETWFLIGRRTPYRSAAEPAA